MAVQSIIHGRFDFQRPVKMAALQHELFSDDNKGDVFSISITDDGKSVDLSGMSVAAYFVRSDNVTIPLTGSVSGNVASVTLTDACYGRSGRFAIVVKVTKGDTRHAVYSASGSVRRSSTDSVIDEEDVIPSLDELLAQIGALENATSAANTATSKANTAADKANAAADEIENLQVNASTLPTGSAATANYADGVLTLGLPRGAKGEKGDQGSAGPVTVNGVEGIGDNITLTGDDVPLSAQDGTEISAAVLQRDRVSNILDNTDFTSPINQRGWTSGTEVAAGQYFIDRWMAATGNAITPTLSSNGLTADGEFFQIIPKSGLVGKTLTAAIGLSDGTVLAKSGVVPADGTWVNFINTSLSGATLMLSNVSEDMLRFRIFCNGNTVLWAALYEGEYTRSTLPAYQPKDYTAELMECMRYYRKIQGGGRLTGFCTATAAYMGLPMTVPMRITPTLTVSSYGTIRANGNNITPTGVSITAVYKDALNITPTYDSVSGISNHVGVWAAPTFTLNADYEP